MKSAKNADKLRIVLDTNILVSTFHFPKGALADIWPLFVKGSFILLLSPTLIHEMARILRNRFHWPDEKVQIILKTLTKKSVIVIPKSIPSAVPTDLDDNHIIACAIEGKANLIVSGDRDLLILKEYEGIPVVRPMDFLRTIQTKG